MSRAGARGEGGHDACVRLLPSIFTLRRSPFASSFRRVATDFLALPGAAAAFTLALFMVRRHNDR